MNNLAALLADPPLLHEDDEGRATSWQLSDEALDFIDSTVGQGWKTLETGEGVSTLLFAIKGADHVCVSPNTPAIERIRKFAVDHAISMQQVSFEADFSDRVLPTLGVGSLDLILIDGGHGFPIPYIDWYYSAPALRVGGLLLLDDTQLWTVDLLTRFLKEEPEWQIRPNAGPRTSVFVKVAEVTPKEWNQQKYVVRMTQTAGASTARDVVSRVVAGARRRIARRSR